MGLDPISIMGIASVASSAIGTGLKAFGDYQAGQDAASTADQNAQLADMAAGDATARGEQGASDIRGTTDRIVGRQRTGYAAAGVDISSGSALDVMLGSRATSERDIATTRENAAKESWGYQQQATQFRRQAQGARQGSLFNLGGQLVAGTTSTLLGTNDLLQRIGGGKKG